MDHQFQLPGSYKKWTYGLIVAGLIALLYGFIMYHPFAHAGHGENVNSTRFWAVLLQNSVYFLLVVNAAMFFICAITLAWGGWQMSFRRVSEAISACVPVVGTICGVILLLICFGGNHEIYHWTDTEHVKHDAILNFKKGFLNKNFFAVMTVLTILSWSLLGRKMRKLSQSIDNKPLNVEEGKKYGITAYELHASKEGEKVYTQEGFLHLNEPTLRKWI